MKNNNNKYNQVWTLLITIGLIVFSHTLLSELSFPKLTGRVVDNANMLDNAVEQRITARLKQHENATTNQVVVVTLNNLGGYSIEQYGVELGRHWGIGQKEKNNGVLLIVAKKERKVRIEVGYGLEGRLTDAISSNIIHNVIVPEFKKGNFSKGIENGTGSIVIALAGQYEFIEQDIGVPLSDYYAIIFICAFILVILIFAVIGSLKNPSQANQFLIHIDFTDGLDGFDTSSDNSWDSSSSSSSSSGGYSGGGGSFGGGGASGSW